MRSQTFQSLTAPQFHSELVAIGVTAIRPAMSVPAGDWFACCETLLQTSPSAHVEADVWSLGASGDATAAGVAEVWYNTRLSVLATPPVNTPLVPYRLTGAVQSSGNGSGVAGGGSGVASLQIGSYGWYANNSHPEVLVDQLLWLAPGGTAGIHLMASCNAWALYNGSEGYCSVDADPTFTLDQAAFDAAMGAQTYRLSEYFGFEYSENLSSGSNTPEPACFLPVAIALAFFACRRRTSERRGRG